MAETLILKSRDRAGRYAELHEQVLALIQGESDPIANQANLVAALKQAFDFFWVGFYRVQETQLVLGPFQGPIACTRIPYGKGVCGAAWAEKRTLVVPDVELFPGHIACASESRSEIVVPVLDASGRVTHVLDVDSDQLDHFGAADQYGLERLMAAIAGSIQEIRPRSANQPCA